MRRTLALLLALLLPVSLLAACGDDDGPSGDDASAELTSRLLDLQDLGETWADDPSLKVDGANGPDCIQEPPEPTYDDQVQAAFTVRETGFPSLREKISEYPDVETISEALGTAIETVDDCGAFSYTADDISFTGTIERIGVDEAGDESAAWRMSLAAQGYRFEALVFYAREGTTGLSLFYIDLDSADVEAFQDLVDAAVAKAF